MEFGPNDIALQIEKMQGEDSDSAQTTELNSALMAYYGMVRDARVPAGAQEITRILIGEPSGSIEADFRDRLGKDRAMNTIHRFIDSHTHLGLNAARIDVICEEMSLNAIYSSLKSHTDLYKEDYAWEERQCKLVLSFNQDWIGVVCIDPVGSLQRNHLLDRLHFVAKSRLVGAKSLHGTSGVGCWMILENSTDLVGMCILREWTVFAARFPVGQPAFHWATKQKNILIKAGV